MQDKARVNSPLHKQQQMRAIIDGAHPAIIEFTVALVKRMGQMGVPMFASECIRDEARQKELFLDGFSQAGPGKSAHQTGQAVDIVHSVHGWNLTRDQWKLIGEVGMDVAKRLALPISSKAWGGNWRFYDPAHWQIDNWQSQVGEYPWRLITYRELKANRKQASS